MSVITKLMGKKITVDVDINMAREHRQYLWGFSYVSK